MVIKIWSVASLMKQIISRLLKISTFVLYYLVATNSAAKGQVTSDGTLTTPTQVVTPSGNVFEINGGTTAGENLFHSFQDFSILNGQEVNFNNSESIANIISRVTGGNISNIDGLIRTMGEANLFLINPSGIMFGPNASLSIGGSFYASSADAILFEDGTVFSAKNPQQQPLLTINVPFGLQLGQNPGAIINRSRANSQFGEFEAGLELTGDNTLAFIGGDITIDNGILTLGGGRIELGGLAEPGIIEINDDGSLKFPEGIVRSNIILTTVARAAVGGEGEAS